MENETARERLRRFYPHISDEHFDEVMMRATSTVKYGANSVEFTREELLVITEALAEKARDIKCGVDRCSKFTYRQIWKVNGKIIDMFTK